MLPDFSTSYEATVSIAMQTNRTEMRVQKQTHMHMATPWESNEESNYFIRYC